MSDDIGDELQRLLRQVHDGIATFDFEGRTVPCIAVDAGRYGRLVSGVAGRPLSVNTDLDILQDGRGNVFVWITLTFSVGGIVERFLVNARTDLAFFEALAETTMLALSSRGPCPGEGSVFMIQLPRPDSAAAALGVIRKALVAGIQG